MIVGPWEATWPAARLGELLREMTFRSGLSRQKVEDPPASFNPDDAAEVELWTETACEWLGVDAEATQVTYPEVEFFLRRGGPAVLRLRVDQEFRFLALLGSRRGRALLLSPDLAIERVPAETVAGWICARLEDPLDGEVRAFLRSAGVAAKDEERARKEILRQRLASQRLGSMWMLRAPAGSSFRRRLSRMGVVGRSVALGVAHAAQYAMYMLSWWIVGRAALQGHIDRGWLTAWVLILFSLVPLRMWSTWLQGEISVRAGGALKQRLLAGAMRLEPEEIRHQGAGELLGKVLESEALESLALGGGFLLFFGSIEVLMASFVLAEGAGGALHVLLLLLWLGVTAGLGWFYFRCREQWTSARLELTHQLVENMLGYRTRLAQEGRAHWHDQEDQELEAYLRHSVGLDRVTASLGALLPRGWLVIGVLGLAPSVVAGEVTLVRVAIGLGGVLLTYRALLSIAAGMAQLFGAVVAWRSVREIFAAAARPQLPSAPGVVVGDRPADGKLLEARDLSFSYPGRPEAVLHSCDVEVREGDRILLQGPSGGGKSTLAALLAGLRRPDSGLLLLGGLDQHSTGVKRWRRQVVLAPQFHENHILSESLAFNLLMGRRWPALPSDIAEAEQVCRELGLGELIERMPAGIFQMVGDTGWQLSHGERNRVFLARTLLQNEGLTILDESFEPLDSGNALRASKLVLERVPSVVAIAHS